jgi:hypothetical protein
MAEVLRASHAAHKICTERRKIRKRVISTMLAPAYGQHMGQQIPSLP